MPRFTLRRLFKFIALVAFLLFLTKVIGYSIGFLIVCDGPKKWVIVETVTKSVMIGQFVISFALCLVYLDDA